MPKRPKITITLVDKVGQGQCHRGHKIGDSWNYDQNGGTLCPLVMHTLFPMIDIVKYGGTLPVSRTGTARFCCPGADVLNIFEIKEGED